MPHILRLSPELLHKVCAHLDQPDLYNLTLTCRMLQQCAEVTLYKEVTITTDHAVHLFKLFYHFPKLSDRVESLTIHAGRPQDNEIVNAGFELDKQCGRELGRFLRAMQHDTHKLADNELLRLEIPQWQLEVVLAELLPRMTKKLSHLAMVTLGTNSGRIADLRDATVPCKRLPLWFEILGQLENVQMEIAPETFGIYGLARVMAAENLKVLSLDITDCQDDFWFTDLRGLGPALGIRVLHLNWYIAPCYHDSWQHGEVDRIIWVMSRACPHLKHFTLQKVSEDKLEDTNILNALSLFKKNCLVVEVIELWVEESISDVVEPTWLEEFLVLRRVVLPIQALNVNYASAERIGYEKRERFAELVRTDKGFRQLPFEENV